jgi:cytochrome c oxidase subunit 2
MTMMKRLTLTTLTGTFAALALLCSTALRAETSNFPADAPLSTDVCMTCHGGYGQGSEVVGGPKLAGMESWYLKRQLQGFRSGFRGVEKDYIPGFEMRATAAILTDAEIDTLVADISSWPDVAVEPTISGDAVAGANLYGTCAACHGANAEGLEALGAPALAGRNDWYLVRQLERFASGARGAHPDDTNGQQMRPMAATLPDATSQQNVVAYINTLGKNTRGKAE